MKTILVIVESPGKIAKIQHILGNGYLVKASVGHIIDLDPKKMSVKIDQNFEPEYKIILGKEGVVKDLIAYTKKSSDVLLAADEDREGEMIAWSIAKELNLKNPKRIVFNSITKEELLNAVANPHQINYPMVDAQKARRVLDRLVGYEISPLLGHQVNGGAKSAGRVQSVVVRLIIDKEDEIKKFFDSGLNSYFKFKGDFLEPNKKIFNSTLFDLTKKDKDGIYHGSQSKIESEKLARDLALCMKSTFEVTSVFDKKAMRSPSAPFTTSTLQQESSRKLGYAIQRTMKSAQILYEQGFITYMRTDSVNLSKEALENIKKYVVEHYGTSYYQSKIYASAKGAQEAHEAIRPTDVFKHEVNGSKIGNDEKTIYNLIWKRAVASQMKSAEFNITNIQISISQDKKHYFETSIENLVFWFPGCL